MFTIGVVAIPGQRPILVDNLPGSLQELESLWSFLSLAMDLCLENLFLTFITGDLVYLSAFERAEKTFCGAIHALPTFREFYKKIGQLHILDHLSGRTMPALSYCSFSSTREVCGDPSVLYILEVLAQYVR